MITGETKTSEKDLGAKIAPGDIVAFRGRGFLSDLILSVQGTPDGASHVALVVTCKPPIIIEAVHPRVRVRLLSAAVDEAEKAWIIHHKTLSDQREEIVASACSLNAFPYGYHNLVLHALDAAFSTTWFSHKWIPSTKGEPEQETHAGLDPLASPDTARSSAWWFKLTVFLLIPVLVPFFVAGSLRALLEEFMTPGLFAVAEGTFLFVLGGYFGISVLSLAETSKWVLCPIVYFWLVWVVFLELHALSH